MKKELVMRNGEVYPVKGRKGKYWVCEETQFRVSNPDILEVRDTPDPEPEPEKAPAAKKKKQPKDDAK